MAIKITPKLLIDGKDYSKSIAMPVKVSDFYNEELDEAHITLKFTHRKTPFKPFTRVDLTFYNTSYFGGNTEPKTGYNKVFVVASDNIKESIVGKGIYDHELYIIEATKVLEGFIVDTTTYTNSNLRSIEQGRYASANWVDNADHFTVRESIFPSVIQVGSGIGINTITGIVASHPYYVSFPANNQNREIIDPAGYATTYSDFDNHYYFFPEPGFYTIRYYGTTLSTESILPLADSYDFFFVISVVEGKSANLKKTTITDAVIRLLDIATPIRKGEAPPFSFFDEQKEIYDKVFLPFLSISQCTLREALREIGKVIHAEPFLDVRNDGKLIIKYLEYGGTTYSNIAKHKYSDCTSMQSINDYATAIDSSVQNLINRISYAKGVTLDPAGGRYRTVRTETAYARVTDGNMYIYTQYPIESVIKLERGSIPGTSTTEGTDLSKYLYERTTYDTQLSDYYGNYPYSKAFGLYFTQGEKGIYGLNYKAEDQSPIFPAFAKYAIVNILEDASNTTIDTSGDHFYQQLSFRVTYVPYVDIRVTQTKSDVEDLVSPAIMAYNQGANAVENRYYGENLKGVVARLGNAEKAYTYILDSFSSIPKVGDKFDDEYYISTVTSEIHTSCIICSVVLSKNYNNISQFVGISSERRQYEISEKSVTDRVVLYREYIVLGEPEEIDNSDIGTTFMQGILSMFDRSQTFSDVGKVTSVVAYGSSYTGSKLRTTELPVQTVPLGNAVVFSWSYQDNFSAGKSVTYQKTGSVSGYWQEDVSYTDSYGKIFYYSFFLKKEMEDAPTDKSYGLLIPAAQTQQDQYIINSTDYILRKDNRERLQFNVEVEFLKNRRSLVIGSGLAKYLPFVYGDYPIDFTGFVFYLCLKPCNTITGKPSGVLGVDYFSAGNIVSATIENGRVKLTFLAIPFACRSIVCMMPISEVTTTVTDDYGDSVQQIEEEGGEVLFADNTTYSAGEIPKPLYFSKKHNVYKKIL